MNITEIEFEQLILDISNIDVMSSVDEQINYIRTKCSISDVKHVFAALSKLNKSKLKVIQNNMNVLSQNNEGKELDLLSKADIEYVFKTMSLIDIEKRYTKKRD